MAPGDDTGKSETASESEAAFVAVSRAAVCEYLDRQGVKHGGLGDTPDWMVAPYLAIWSVRSAVNPDAAGWYAIQGDVPTDYVSTHDARDPREVLRHFSRVWRDIADHMERGAPHPDARIGSPETWADLAPLLRSRAEFIGRVADDDDAWQ